MASNKGDKGKRNQRDGKQKRPPIPLSEDFGDSEFSEEHFSFEGEDSPLPAPLSSSFDYSDDSMGLSVVERAYIRSIEQAGLEESNDSEEEDSLEDSEGEDSEEDSEEEDDGGGDGSGYEGGDEGGNNGNGGNESGGEAPLA
jgi:hypothetical protein